MFDRNYPNTPAQQRVAETLRVFDRWCRLLVWALMLLPILLNFRVGIVSSGSMYPTLGIGEAVLCQTVADARELERDRIILFHGPDRIEGSDIWCKRLIGIPGDTILVTESGVIRNGVLLSEPYRLEKTTCHTMDAPITLGENEYFVMGDNRNNSYDSRSIGPISGDVIIGYAIVHRNFMEDPALTAFLDSVPAEQRNPDYTGP